LTVTTRGDCAALVGGWSRDAATSANTDVTRDLNMVISRGVAEGLCLSAEAGVSVAPSQSGTWRIGRQGNPVLRETVEWRVGF